MIEIQEFELSGVSFDTLEIYPKPYEIAQMIWSLNEQELAEFIKIMSEDEELFKNRSYFDQNNLEDIIAKDYTLNDRKKATYYFLNLADLILKIEQEQS